MKRVAQLEALVKQKLFSAHKEGEVVRQPSKEGQYSSNISLETRPWIFVALLLVLNAIIVMKHLMAMLSTPYMLNTFIESVVQTVYTVFTFNIEGYKSNKFFLLQLIDNFKLIVKLKLSRPTPDPDLENVCFSSPTI